MEKYNVNDAHVEAAIVQEVFLRAGAKSLICILMMDSGDEVVAAYTPLVPFKDETELAEHKTIARDLAKTKVKAKIEAVMHWRYAIDEARAAAAEAAEAEKKVVSGKEEEKKVVSEEVEKQSPPPMDSK